MLSSARSFNSWENGHCISILNLVQKIDQIQESCKITLLNIVVGADTVYWCVANRPRSLTDVVLDIFLPIHTQAGMKLTTQHLLSLLPSNAPGSAFIYLYRQTMPARARSRDPIYRLLRINFPLAAFCSMYWRLARPVRRCVECKVTSLDKREQLADLYYIYI